MLKTSYLPIRIHTVISGTVPDDHMIENFNADDFAGIDKGFGYLQVFHRGSRITGRMIVLCEVASYVECIGERLFEADGMKI